MNNVVDKKINITNTDNIIEVELQNKQDYKNKFNEEKISKEFSMYILNELKTTDLKSNISIIIKSKEKLTDYEKQKLSNMIKTTFKDDLYDIKLQYETLLKNAYILMIIGAIILIGFYLSNNLFFISEYILIIGWLIIWESAAIFLFDRGKTKIKKIRRKQLIESKIIFK